MALEGVPWMIGSGANHSAEVGRLLAYAACGGAEGVVGPGDFKVTQSVVADGNINIAAGGAAMLNQFPGGGQQMYLERNNSPIVKAMTPQGAGGPRYDLVTLLVHDPQYAGQPAPVSVADGPYCEIKVYENVASTVKTLAEVDPNKTGIALARVAFSASDSVVTTAEITDLRQMVQPRIKKITKIISPGGTTALPGAYGTAPVGASWNVDVPKWATRVRLTATWAGVQFVDTASGAGAAGGGARVALGAMVSDVTAFQVDATASNKPITQTLVAAGDVAVSSGVRGTTLALSAQLQKNSGSGMTANTNVNTTCIVECEFYEDVE